MVKRKHIEWFHTGARTLRAVARERGIEDAFQKMERGEVLRSVVLLDDAEAAAADSAAVEAVTPGEPGAP